MASESVLQRVVQFMEYFLATEAAVASNQNTGSSSGGV